MWARHNLIITFVMYHVSVCKLNKQSYLVIAVVFEYK